MSETVDENQMQISFLLVVRNEQRYVGPCLQSMLDQTLDPAAYEVIVVDGMSADTTRRVVRDIIAEHPQRRIRLLDNPDRILSAGWNVGIRAARGRYVIRPDAHAEVPRDFLERNLAVMQEHPEAWAVGGMLDTRGRGFWGEVIAQALSCRMGVGGSSFRVGGRPGPADTVVFGLYRRDRLLAVGGFDESIPLNQDNVCHGRIRQQGGILRFDPSIRSTYYCRDSLGALWRQMFRRSLWLMLMTKHQLRGAMQVRYLVPVAFVLTLAGLLAAGVFWRPAAMAAVGLLGVHLLAGWGFALPTNLSSLQKLCLPVVFLTMHAAYGIGSLLGLLALPFYRPRPTRSINST